MRISLLLSTQPVISAKAGIQCVRFRLRGDDGEAAR